MKKRLREGFSTGSCMTGAAQASAIWQMTGHCPTEVKVETPIGKTLYLEVIPKEYGTCAIKKDAGDDPDVTDKSEIVVRVDIGDVPVIDMIDSTAHINPEDKIINKDIDMNSDENHILNGTITFDGGEGIGIITQEGLKIPVGLPAINPVPRQMTIKALREIIGNRSAVVHVSVPGGEKLAKKTFNPRLGIVGGLSILGTTGIVRPMSEEAMKDSLLAELDMYANQGHHSILFVLGTTGENALKDFYGQFKCILQVSNYIGFMIEEAVERGFTNILIGGFVGKLVKVASGTMNTHSHVSDGRIETICTHAALAGADKTVIEKVYNCLTTKAAMKIIEEEGLQKIWSAIAQKASLYCEKTAHGDASVGIILLDADNRIIGESQNAQAVLDKVLEASEE